MSRERSSISSIRNPTRPGRADVDRSADRQLRGQPGAAAHDNQFDVRVDHALSGANRAFVRYSLQDAWRADSARPAEWRRRHRRRHLRRQRAERGHQRHARLRTPLAQRAPDRMERDRHRLRAGSAPDRTSPSSWVSPGSTATSRPAGWSPCCSPRRTCATIGSGGTGTANTSALQVTDSVTHLRGRHTFKVGGSLILRRRHVYFSDSPLGLFGHNTNVTSSCAGQTPAARRTRTPGFRSPASCSAILPLQSRGAGGAVHRAPPGDAPRICRTTSG